jgi:hypothetical protein
MRDLNSWLRSEETGQPFRQCVECAFPLMEIDAPWLVNKDYFKGECVIEYAICQPCRDLISARISQQSKAVVREFLEKEIDWDSRTAEFMNMVDPVERFAACIACREPRQEVESFAISALFDSDGQVTCGVLPLLICRSCVGRMTAALSAESREVWQQFLRQRFAGPPDGAGEDESFGDFGIF